MLAEITGVMQITTCVLIIGATGVWLYVLKVCNDSMNQKFWDCMEHEKRIISLEYEVAKLTRLASINHQLEEVRERIEKHKQGAKND